MVVAPTLSNIAKCKFVRGPVLKATTPRPPPPFIRGVGYGECCFRAVCHLHAGDDPRDPPAGKFSGYDRSVKIADEVEFACKLHALKVPGTHCGSPELTMLPSSRRSCQGELYFTFDGDTHSIK